MKALRYLAPGRLAIEDVPVPSISPGEVLVAIGACGLCATDVKTYKRGHPRIPAGAVLGHEMAGTIVAVAEAESDSGRPESGSGRPESGSGGRAPRWAPGDRVAVPPYLPCGRCVQCLRGRPTLCPHLMEARPEPGGFAELVRVPERIVNEGLVRLADHVEFPIGAFVEPLACVVHGYDALDLKEGDPLVVIGDGPMGLLHLELGRLNKASPIVLVGATDDRLAFARERADVVVDARVDDVPDRVGQVTGGGAAGVAVCVGATACVATALTLVRPGGVVNVFAGMPSGDLMSMDLHRVHYEEVKLVGTFGSGPADFQRAAGLIADGGVDVSPYITARAPLDGAIAAFDRALAYEGIKTVVLID
jgi:L-iditol 2-dehydrogenase